MKRLSLVLLLALFGCRSSKLSDESTNERKAIPRESGPRYWGAIADGLSGMEGAELSCFYSARRQNVPATTVQFRLETFDAKDAVHVRVTFDPSFVDNTYGTTAIGWTRGHKFGDLVGSDHAELVMTDATSTKRLDFKIDYISVLTSAPSGYATLGVTGGDGKMITGAAASILKSMTSLDRNFNERGYNSYKVNSPQTDATYTPNAATPNWDYRVVYEAWVDKAAFEPSTFQKASLTFVHASPSKTGNNTEMVEPGECPPSWTNNDDVNEGGSTPSGAGTPCTEGSECISGKCTDGYCEQGSGGAPCKTGFDCSSNVCGSDSVCEEGSTGPSGGTSAPKGAGDACTSGTECMSEACTNSKCEKSAPGYPCAVNADCSNNTCVSGYCDGGFQ